jgi:hypothetical protein
MKEKSTPITLGTRENLKDAFPGILEENRRFHAEK